MHALKHFILHTCQLSVFFLMKHALNEKIYLIKRVLFRRCSHFDMNLIYIIKSISGSNRIVWFVKKKTARLEAVLVFQVSPWYNGTRFSSSFCTEHISSVTWTNKPEWESFSGHGKFCILKKIKFYRFHSWFLVKITPYNKIMINFC